ncbi:MAG TPA: hypothetical protein VG893_08105 [Terracidiphilus sp.]|nr:hypothetical protein [Terracidiphilus sp.]
MFTLLKGDCEHCGQVYRYSLLNAEFGDFSYAYCDACGKLATFNCASSFLLSMPRLLTSHQVIDAAWEPYIRSCDCGGSFRRGAAPRCVACAQPLSAEHAAAHIEHNFVSGGRGWRWQGNWSDVYCIDIEDPAHPGELRHVTDPFLDRTARAAAAESPSRGWLSGILRHNR